MKLNVFCLQNIVKSYIIMFDYKKEKRKLWILHMKEKLIIMKQIKWE